MIKDDLKISTVTFNAEWGNKEANLKRILSYIDDAAKVGSNMIVFPEMALTGYDDENNKAFTDKMQYKEAETIPGPSTDIIADAAKKHGMYVLVGMPERDANDYDTIYNSLAIFSPEGLVGTYRKIHLPEPEPNWATSGDTPFILDTEWGPVGIAVCYDNYCFPELRRYYASKGCRLSINSTAYPKVLGDQVGDITLQSGVIQDGIYIVSSNLGGVDLYNDFWGGSSIIGPSTDGPFAAKYYAGTRFPDPAGHDEQMITATIDLSLANRGSYVYNPKLDRPSWRPDIYKKMLESSIENKPYEEATPES